MCFCEKPTINGTAPVKTCFEYPASSYQPNPPALQEDESLLFDEPGRCGGIDSHAYHYRVAKWHSIYFLLVRHGGGDERLRLHLYGRGLVEALTLMGSNTRYWILNETYQVHSDAKDEATAETSSTWRKAAAEKRIKTRKQPSRGVVKVWIEPAKPMPK